MTANDILRMLKRRLAAAGLPAHVFKSHSLRASTATTLLEQGVELSDVQYLWGHSDPRTTKLYDRRKQSVTRNIVERIAIWLGLLAMQLLSVTSDEILLLASRDGLRHPHPL